MEIKGTAVKTTPVFIKEKYPDRYYEWLNSLPEESKDIMSGIIYATTWYPLYESVIIPTQKAAELFFDSDEEAAFAIGEYSSQSALKGVYKIFVRVSSPNFVLSRSTNIFATYYKTGRIQLVEQTKNSSSIKVWNFDPKNELILHRIYGWVYRTMIIITKKEVSHSFDKFVDDNGKIGAIIKVEW